jgi:cellulose synthase/poly-beta-1,6-N-acetylglucosamine synthase-like glycosyltransferase
MQVLPDSEDIFTWIVLILFCVFAFIQIFWVVFFYARLAFHKESEGPNEKNIPITIIIAARNEEDNLFHLLPKILAQDYPEFEVIVVNHQSSDDSSHILKAFQRQYPNLKVIELERSKHLRNGKKLPLTIAIKGAKYEHLMFTDADCEPNSKNWLSLMSNKFTDKKEIVLGYGPYKREPGLLNQLIRLDTAMIAANYLSYAKAGAAYMGIGRNMGYTRSLFLSVNGFKSHYALQSGDDDLFIQEAAKKGNYDICIHPDSFSYSESKKTWADWYKQKSRHFTTTEHYSVIKKLLLGIYPLSLLLLYTSFITLCINYQLCWLSIGVFSFITLIKWVIQGRILLKLKEKGFVWIFPIWDLVYAALAPIMFYTTEKSTQNQWK